MEQINPNRLPIFDTHAHYDDTAFADGLPNLIKQMQESGVIGIINNGVNYASSKKAVELANTYDICYAAVGVHPEDLYANTTFDGEKLRSLLADPKVVAVGEIGLDYHWNTHPADYQKLWFIEQLRFAKEKNLPVIIHDREAHNDTLEILKAERPNGVLHCFSGSVEMAREVLKLGLYIGIGGVVTFKNARKLVDVVQELPLERLLLETDAPYLSPEPFRGKRCSSDMIFFTASRIAEIKGISVEEVFDANLKNLQRLFTKIKI